MIKRSKLTEGATIICIFFAILETDAYDKRSAGFQNAPINLGNFNQQPAINPFAFGNGQAYPINQGQVYPLAGGNLRPVGTGVPLNQYQGGFQSLPPYHQGVPSQFSQPNPYATGIRPASVTPTVWAPVNRIPGQILPGYQQTNIQQANLPLNNNAQLYSVNNPVVNGIGNTPFNQQLSGYASNVNFNRQPLRPNLNNGIQYNVNVPQTAHNQLVPGGNYFLQNNNVRQPVVYAPIPLTSAQGYRFTGNQGVNLPVQSTVVNPQVVSPYFQQGVQQSTNPILVRANNGQIVQVYPSLWQTQSTSLRNSFNPSPAQQTFRPSPQLPNSFSPVVSKDSQFIPINVANLEHEEWRSVVSDESKASDESIEAVVEKSKPSKTEKTKQIASTAKSSSKKVAASETTTKPPKAKAKPTATAAKTEPVVVESAETDTTAEDVELTKASKSSNTSQEKPDGGLITPPDSKNSSATSNESDKNGQAAEAEASPSSEPLVLAAAEPAFLDLLKEDSSTKTDSVKS